jgi:hypothetical protein
MQTYKSIQLLKIYQQLKEEGFESEDITKKAHKTKRKALGTRTLKK